MDLSLDWNAPWFAPWRERGESASFGVAEGLPLHEALNAQGAAPVKFTRHDALPSGAAYEKHIFSTGQCPVREGLHDFFNGLVWMEFPRTKLALNRMQATEIAREGIGPRRGAVRDAITLFDENGAVLHAPPPLWEALRAHDWHALFIHLRPLWREARLTVFGHALLEQLARPRKNLTAHVWLGDAPTGRPGELDAWLADRMSREALSTKPFTPLPVLGVPGWWAGNEAGSFYDDSSVFRARRRLNSGGAALSAPAGPYTYPSENQ